MWFLSVTKVSACLRNRKFSDMAINIGGMRHPYKTGKDVFLETDLVSKEPIGQFKQWFEEACSTEGIMEANAMNLATATRDGIPSSRMVLLKGYGKEGFKFYTNYNSRKGKELMENPLASLCFYWEPLMRSVRIEGTVEKLSTQESEEYFNSRPRASQIGANISEQSQVIESRQVLTEKEASLAATYADATTAIPKPANWGGYLVVPRVIEFWQGQSNRVHDRIRFRRLPEGETPGEHSHAGQDGWQYERLAP